MDKDLLVRFFEGNTSLQEEMRIRKWMEASPENYQAFLKERKLFDAMLLLTEEDKVSRLDGFGVFKGGWLKKIIEIAAVVVITVGLTVFYQYFSDKQPLLAMQKVMVPAGQRISLELSDGTIVWLNSRTRIEYPASFTGDDRRLKLDGEAYFEVTRDIHKPFVVETTKGEIEVLGTKFNVEAYSEDDVFATALMEGSVRIRIGNQQSLLCPNQLARLEGKKFAITPIEDFNLYRWKEGLICFRDETFPNIMKKFEKYYGVKVIIENGQVSNYRCTGKFRQSDGVLYALKVLQKDINFKIRRDEDNNIVHIE